MGLCRPTGVCGRTDAHSGAGLSDLSGMPWPMEVSPFFRRRFPHLVVKEIPALGIENVSFTPRSEMVVVRPCPSTLNEVPFFPRLRQTPLARRIDFRNR